MWTDSTLKPIYDSDQYVASNGTTYPANFPKSEIAGLHAVTVTAAPDPTIYRSNEFTIDENYNQVWVTLSAEEIAARKKERVPHSVTMRQARLALLNAGKLDTVATAIASMPSPQKEVAQIEWDHSQVVERNRPLTIALGAVVGLSDTQLDDLFLLAQTL